MNAGNELDPAEYIRSQTMPTAPKFVPELRLHMAVEGTEFWRVNEGRLRQADLPPAFWAFAWPGGQGIARYLLDRPDSVRGKRVMDIAAGSGIGAVAAMKAGAKSAVAVDIDPLALQAAHMNADLNRVAVATLDFVDFDRPPKHVDVIIAGDVCYQHGMAYRLTRWLWLSVAAGIRVLLADPGRAYVPESGLTLLATYTVPTSCAIEEDKSRTVKVWDVGLPGVA